MQPCETARIQIFFPQLFLWTQEMCLHHPEGFNFNFNFNTDLNWGELFPDPDPNIMYR